MSQPPTDPPNGPSGEQPAWPSYGQPPAGEQPAWSPYDPSSSQTHQPPQTPQQSGYGQPDYSQPPAYGQGYPPPPYGYAAVQPDHPKATHALVWGLVALVGGLVCWLPIFVSPVAWVVGARARREIDAQPGLGGRGQATAGMVMGIIGTVLLVLGMAFVVLLVVLAASGAFDPESSTGYSGTNA